MIDLSSLNAEQLEAVKDDENNLLILACAGSGKTKTITTKIAYTIETGRLRPYEICAVTFTNRAAKEMRDRVETLLPDIDTQSIVLRTFHSLGATLLRRFGSAIGLSSDFTIYDDDDSLQLLLSSAGSNNEEGQTQRKKYLREVLKNISKAKDLGLGPDAPSLDRISDDPNFRILFSGYEEALARTGNVDFADLIKKAKELLETSENARNYCHRRFKLVMVDEYQDSNREQFNFLRLFVGENTQLVVVGDDDQSIYSFRGADVENILTFSKSFGNVREIKLEKNYRSTDEILAPAAALIKHNTARHDKNIVSADGKRGQKPVVMCSQSGVMEAKRVTNIILSDRDFDNTAVLYRTNAQSQAFETEFLANKIPYKVIGALKFYEREEVKDGLAFLRLLINHKDEISFRRIINKPARGLGEKKVDEIVSNSVDLMEGLEIFVSSSSGKAAEGASSFLNAWKKAEKALEDNEDLGDILYGALQDTGLLKHFNSEKDEVQRRSRIENLSQLVSVLSGGENEEDSLSEEFETVKEKDSKKALRAFLENITLDTT
ncbi:MAG: ATP-dependent helicase, partial [Candidatus Ornithospirochaeta sp.]